MKPLLGTFVSIRLSGLAVEAAQAAADAGFDEIARIHALMSFHESGSDVSRLNREAFEKKVRVDPRTYAVLARALFLSRLSEGAFDISVAGDLVACGALPHPQHAIAPDPSASWRDICLLPDFTVTFHRPLWIDLGGIAKGYAVDRALEVLIGYGPAQCCINAGGDLRIDGENTERVALDADLSDSDFVPIVELGNGSLASSYGTSVHRDGRQKTKDCGRQFVSVAAPRCMDADGLTKIVLAKGACAARILGLLNAEAIVHDAAFGWRRIAGSA